MRPTALLIGIDIPLALIRASGFSSVRGSLADLAEPVAQEITCIVISHLRASNAQAYHRVRATGSSVPVFFLDLPTGTSDASVRYSERRLRELAANLGRLSGEQPSDDVLRWAIASEARAAAELSEGSTSAGGGARSVLLGCDVARRGDDGACDNQIVWIEDEDGYGPASRMPVAESDPWNYLAADHARRAQTTTRSSLDARAGAAIAAARDRDASVLLLAADGDRDARAWFRAALLRRAGADFDIVDLDVAAPDLSGLIPEKSATEVLPTTTTSTTAADSLTAARPRARKVLTVTAEFGAYQREWFQSVRDRALAGEPFAVVNADSPQEVLRALDIPFVVNQWWASIAAAKGGAARSRGALRDAGLPESSEPYNSQGLADLIAGGDGAPWGGLPRPQILQATRGEDAIAGIFEEWARRSDAALILFDRTVESRQRFPIDWWERLPDDWEEILEASRLDLMTEQLRSSISTIEAVTGRTLDPNKLRMVLDLVNEQEEWFRLTRDLIATSRPAPVSIVDSIPATMIPQWHRGTEWGRDAARAFYEEVKSRVNAGQSVCADERVRVLWVGRGLWQHMWLYQAFEESHGAVFVWSMYLGLAADGYVRRIAADQDPMRSLAARFVTVGDELRMPLWAAAWHLTEARRHGVHAVIAVDDAEPFVLDELERAGYPVLRLEADNLAENPDDIAENIRTFLDSLSAGGRVGPRDSPPRRAKSGGGVAP